MLNNGQDDRRLQMFLVSFLVLFLELASIRWFPAHIRHLGYFTNYILMACFLGIGIGIMAGRKGRDLSLFFIPALATVFLLVCLFRLQIRIPTDEVVYFQGSKLAELPVEPYYMIPAVFFLVSMLFILIASPMGKLFDEMDSLAAYMWNIYGSLSGIALFTLLSYLRFPPYVWMVVFFGIYFIFNRRRRPVILILAGLSILVILAFFIIDRGSIWSFYYKITLKKGAATPDKIDTYSLYVNDTGHQCLRPSSQIDREPMYGEVYRHYAPARFREILILGAGAGDDAAYNLSRGAGSIDAVEIDPVIMELGKALHPEKPYQNGAVRLFAGDGRTFMRKSSKKYDCIIFALPDSLVLGSGYSNLRLESYLFTVDSFRDAGKLLKPDGVMVLYNYFRTKWLIDKLSSMLESAYGYPPAVYVYPPHMACFITGPGSRALKRTYAFPQFTPATDDWPFLYLLKPSFPRIYVKMILSVIIITLILYFFSAGQEKRSFSLSFFFLGAAFMVLEAKCVVTFSLLFGSTWCVNSVVFAIILFLVLLALHITARSTMRNGLCFYLPLLGVVVLNYLVPPGAFIGAHFMLQKVIAPIFYLLPVFFANLVFAYGFRDSSSAAVAFASNMLGAILGGIAEYASMITGYNNLLVLIFLFYLAAYYFYRFHDLRAGHISEKGQETTLRDFSP